MRTLIWLLAVVLLAVATLAPARATVRFASALGSSSPADGDEDGRAPEDRADPVEDGAKLEEATPTAAQARATSDHLDHIETADAPVRRCTAVARRRAPPARARSTTIRRD